MQLLYHNYTRALNTFQITFISKTHTITHKKKKTWQCEHPTMAVFCMTENSTCFFYFDLGLFFTLCLLHMKELALP